MIPASLRPRHGVLASLLSVLLVVAGCGGLPLFQAATPPPSSVTPGSTRPAGETFPSGGGEDFLFVPPEPVCPAPPGPVVVPQVTASAGSGSVLVTVGSSSVMTCSSSDSVPLASGTAVVPLRVAPGDVIRLALPPGWRFLYWQGWNIPGASAANTTPEGETPDHPASITLPVPGNAGSWVVGLSIWAISDDWRAVAGIEGTVLVQH